MSGAATIGKWRSSAWGEVCATRTTYANGGTAVELRCRDEEGEPFEPLARLSVWLEDSPTLPPDHFYAKTWSENEEIAQEALASGLFEKAKGFLPAHPEVWRIKA